MTLSELKAIESAAKEAEGSAQRHLARVQKFAAARLRKATLVECLEGIRRYESDKEFLAALDRAEAMLRDDIFRLAEMEFEGKAREQRLLAGAKWAQLTAYFGQPEIAEVKA